MSKKVKTICKDKDGVGCGAEIVSTGKRSIPCLSCGRKWEYSINIDESIHLWMRSKRVSDSDRRIRRHVFTSKNEEEKIKAAGYTRQKVMDYGYNSLILGLDRITCDGLLSGG
jgi:hypothetical protein